MKRRRILHCIPDMGGGGAERQLTYLAGALPAFGWDVHVALRFDGPNLESLAATGATIHRVRGLTNHDPHILWQLFSVMRRLKPDLVQLWLLQMEIAGAIAATVARIPWILTERSSELAYPPTWKNRLRIAIASRAAAIVANSPDGDRFWAGQRLERPRRAVIPNALPKPLLDATEAGDPRAVGLPLAGRVVMFAGRLSEEKNVRTLLRAVRAVLTDVPDAVAVLAGEGPLRAEVDALRSAPTIGPRVAVPGYLSDPWPLMKRADAFVSVSQFEGHPNTVLEAAACGAPLVLSDIPAHRAMFDEGCAQFAPADDTAAIAAAIAATLEEPGPARARADRARSRLVGLDCRAIAARYDRLYRQLLGEHDFAETEDTERETGRAAG